MEAAQGPHRILMASHLCQRVVGQLSPRLAGAGGVRGVLRSVDSNQGCATIEVATAAASSAQGHAARGQGWAAAMRARLENLSLSARRATAHRNGAVMTKVVCLLAVVLSSGGVRAERPSLLRMLLVKKRCAI